MAISNAYYLSTRLTYLATVLTKSNNRVVSCPSGSPQQIALLFHCYCRATEKKKTNRKKKTLQTSVL